MIKTTQIKLRVCWFHYQDEGEFIPATHTYYATVAKETFDVCEEHAKKLEKLQISVTEIKMNPEIISKSQGGD